MVTVHFLLKADRLEAYPTCTADAAGVAKVTERQRGSRLAGSLYSKPILFKKSKELHHALASCAVSHAERAETEDRHRSRFGYGSATDETVLTNDLWSTI